MTSRFFSTSLALPIIIVASTGMISSALAEGPTDEAIATILDVGKEGKGNKAAGIAWQVLSKADASALPDLLKAMDSANPIAANYLKGAVDAIIDRTKKAGKEIPVGALGEFLLDTRHEPRARRLAFDLIAGVDPGITNRLVPGMLNDPAVELRRDAVQLLMDEAGKLKEADKKFPAILVYRQALNSARDVQQITTIDKTLQELGETVDLPEHFGFLMHWKTVGPFDNTERKGFNTAFPPEEGVDLEAEYEGKTGKVKWSDLTTSDDFGMVDVNQPYGQLKEVTAYAYSEFNSQEARPAQIRIGCKNAWKIWLNGKFVFGRDEHHRGMRIDQYQLPIRLKKGRNTILVKLCQNEQKERWTVEWQFQLRVCDSTGTAILATDRPETPREEKSVDGKDGNKSPRRRRPSNP